MNLFDKSPKFLKVHHFFTTSKDLFFRLYFRVLGENRFDLKDDVAYSWVFIKNSIKNILCSIIVVCIALFIELHLCSQSTCSDGFKDNYVTILVSIAAIETLFIGLYYAGMTSVASVAYAKVPSEIRNLLISDPVSKLFMGVASVSSIFVYFVIGICFLIDVYSKIALVLAILSAIFVIPSFLFLGKRLFTLFNPRNWMPFLQSQLDRQWYYLKKMNRLPFPDDCAVFCQKQGLGIVHCIECLNQILISDADYSKRNLYHLDCEIISILQQYQKVKCSFPTDSCWYVKKHQYKTIVEQDFSQNTYLFNFQNQKPVNGHDVYWFEDCLEDILFDGIKKYVDDSEFTAIVPVFNNYLTALTRNEEFARAHAVIDRLWGLKPSAFKKEYWGVSFVENAFILEINLIVALANSEDKIALNRKLKNIDFQNGDNLYKQDFNFYQLKDLEKIRKKMQLEIEIEGRVVTPLWHVLDSLCQYESIRFNDNYKLLTKNRISCFESRMKETELSCINKCSVLKCISEYWNRVFILESKIEQIQNSLKKNIMNPIFEFERMIPNDYRIEYQNHLNSITTLMSVNVPIVAAHKHNEDRPDSAGILILRMFENCFDLALDGNCDVAENCVKNGLISIFLQTVYAKNINEIKEYVDYAILVSNVLLVFSEYYSNGKLKSLVDSAWDSQMKFWFENEFYRPIMEKGREILFCDIDETSMGLTCQVAQRYERIVSRLLDKVPYVLENVDNSMMYRKEAKVDHSSTLIKILVKKYRETSQYRLEIDIKHPFIVHYFMKSPYMQGCNFGWQNECLKRQQDELNAKK